MNVFDQLNILLMESKGSSKSEISIHPEMETKEQGEMAAAEKVLKLFQRLMAGSNGPESVKDGRPEIPDDFIDPMFKNPPKDSKDKTFEKNKLSDWDEDSDEKFQKEIEDMGNEDSDDDFDDFDYRNNPFGDDDNDDDTEDDNQSQGGDDNRSESEKLKDSIEDALNNLDDGDDDDDDGDDDDSGANWGDDDDDDGEGGQGGEDGEDGQQGENQNGGQGKKSSRQKHIEDMINALNSDNMEEFNDKIEDMKHVNDPKMNNAPGGIMETPSDEDVIKDMKKSGLDDKSIEKITKEKNIDSTQDISEAEMEKLKKQAIEGLERKIKGGSALADTIVTNSLQHKITDDDWKTLLELFLKPKSKKVGDLSNSNKDEIKWGHKNHLWRDAILPDSAESSSTIQNIHCFVDFTGSVNKNLVFSFLGKVVDLCVKLKYTDVNVYGFAINLSVPRKINKKLLKEKGVRVALSETWDFIRSQNLGQSDRIKEVADEINRIKRKEPDSVFLLFGDGEWYTVDDFKYISRQQYFNDMCVLSYYTDKPCKMFKDTINKLINVFKVKYIITSKAQNIVTE